MLLTDLKQIRNGYSCGIYGEYKVIANTSNGWINATKFCKLGGKNFKEWKKKVSSKMLMLALQKELGGGTELMKAFVTNKTAAAEDRLLSAGTYRLLSGTYVHPDLFPHIASWMSPHFALEAGRIVNDSSSRLAVKTKPNDDDDDDPVQIKVVDDVD